MSDKNVTYLCDVYKMGEFGTGAKPIKKAVAFYQTFNPNTFNENQQPRLCGFQEPGAPDPASFEWEGNFFGKS